jgi:hypothetical protein
LHRVLQRLADEPLRGNSRHRRRGSHRVEQLPGQTHVHPLTLGLKLKSNRSQAGQVVSGKIGLLDKLLSCFIASETRQFLFIVFILSCTAIRQYIRLYCLYFPLSL